MCVYACDTHVCVYHDAVVEIYGILFAMRLILFGDVVQVDGEEAPAGDGEEDSEEDEDFKAGSSDDSSGECRGRCARAWC